jgi:hypothetical protein
MLAPALASDVFVALPGNRHLKGIAVCNDGSGDLVLAAVPEVAPLNKRYSVKTVDGNGHLPVIFVVVPDSSLEIDRSGTWKPESIVQFPEELDRQNLIAVYQGEATNSGSIQSAAAAAGSSMTASPTLGTAPVLPSDPVLDALRDLRAEMLLQRSALASLEARVPPPTAQPPAASARKTWEDYFTPEADDDDEWPPQLSSESRRPGSARPPSTGIREGVRFMEQAPLRPSAAVPQEGVPPSQIEQLTNLIKELRRSPISDDALDDMVPGNKSLSGLKGIHAMRERIYAEPDKVISAYVEHMKRQLGVTDTRQFWRVRDWSMKQEKRFGRMKGMLRLYVMIGDILDHSLNGRHLVTSALLIQAQKCLLQMALDGGLWDNGRLLWPEPDPFEQVEFGGLEEEMSRVHAYRKAINDLKSRGKGMGQSPDDEDSEGASAATAGHKKKQPKGGKKGGGTAAAAPLHP